MSEKDTLVIPERDNGGAEIYLIDILYLIRRHFFLLLFVMILFGGAGYLYTRYLLTPMYTATSSIYVVSASENSILNLTDLNMGTSLASDYVQLAQSRTMLERVLEETGENLSLRELQRMLTVRNVSSTRILEFSIVSPDPEQATRLANAFLNQAIRYLPEVMGVHNNDPTAVDPAVLPTIPTNLRYRTYIALSAMSGFLLVVGVLIIQLMMNDTFDSEDDVERYLGVTPMAVIPENGQKHKDSGYRYYAQKPQKNQREKIKTVKK